MRARRVVVENPADGGFLYWLFKFHLFGIIIGVALVGIALPTFYLWIAKQTPPLPEFKEFSATAGLETSIFAADGTRLTTLAKEERYLLGWNEVPPLLIQAFLAAEDRSFYQHRGIDFRGVLRAFLANLKAGGVRQGGSTITQQLAKTYLSPERSVERKLKELVLARRIEARYSKQQILHLYLSKIFLGSRAYGVKAAAKVYFNKSLKKLTISEMAIIAGLARAPSRFSPKQHPKRALERRNQVLGQMRSAGFITQAHYDEATKEPLQLYTSSEEDPFLWISPYFTEQVRRTLIDRYGEHLVYRGGWRVETTLDLSTDLYARDHVLASVGALDRRQGYRGPIAKLRTTQERHAIADLVHAHYGDDSLRPDLPYPVVVEKVFPDRAIGRLGHRQVVFPRSLMQWAAPYSRTNPENETLLERVDHTLKAGDLVWGISPEAWRRAKTWGNPTEKQTTLSLYQIPRTQGSLYAYDHQTGYVLALAGGIDYDLSSFNRATQACRQPGSVYKPIYYALALDGETYSMATVLHDKPYQPEEGETWNPQNIHGTLDGNVTLYYSLIKSLNLPSIQILEFVGAKEAASWARRLGFTTPIHADKALALGASCVRMDELTRAFATFVRGGTQKDPIYIRQVIDRSGYVIEDHTDIRDPFLDESDRLDRLWAKSRYDEPRVIDEKTAFLTTYLLRESVLHGIAARCRIVPVPTGGKGGTSSDTMDVWFTGFTSRWAVTAWMGDDTYERPLGAKEASYTTSIPMWANFMRHAVANHAHTSIPLTVPKGILKTEIDPFRGGKPQEGEKGATIYYRPGSYEPTQ